MANYAVKKIHKNMYPATYNFKDEADGDFPSGWVDGDGADCATTVIASKDSHRKVLQFYDDGIGTRAQATISVTQGLNTEFEFWLTKSSIAADTAFYVWLYEGATRIIYLLFEADDLQYNDGGWQDLKLNFLVANTLSHFRIVLDDTANTFSCYVDGILIGAAYGYENNSTSGIDSMVWRSDNTDTGYYTYMDALGVSPDTDYKIGDNIHWRHYKDQDSDFESEDVGTSETSIGFVDAEFCEGVGTAKIIPSFDEHKKILELYHGPIEADLTGVDNDFAAQTNGTIEFWIKTSDATMQSYFMMYSGGVQKNVLAITADLFQVYDGEWQELATVPLDNTWYHIRIDFECAAGAYKGLAADTATIYINNVSQGTYGFSAVTDNIDNIKFLCDSIAAYYTYIDAVSYSWSTGNEMADNRIFDYNDSYTREDITTEIVNAKYSNKLYEWRKCTIFTTELFEKDLYVFQVYDINSKLSFEGELKGKSQDGVLYRYPLRDKNWDALNDRITHTFTTDDIHDPTDSATLLLTALPNVGQEDGDLILVEGDPKTTVYSPVLKRYPRYMFLRDIADIADSTIIITPEGKVYMDDDLASGTVLDVDTPADKELMLDDPRSRDILETINYFEIFGAIDPDTGERFYKIIDNSGTDRKRKWRYTNNDFENQTDLDNYAAKLVARVVPVKIITINVQGIGIHNMGTTLDYKFVHFPINIPQGNYYIIEERVSFDTSEHIIVLSEGMIEESKYSAGFERPQNYMDSFAGEIYETDINTVYPELLECDGATRTKWGILLDGLGEASKCYFFITGNIDHERKIIITVGFIRADANNDTISIYKDLHYHDMGGSAQAVWNGVATTLPACAINEAEKLVLTIDSADIATNRLYYFYVVMNEAGRSVYITTQTVVYYIKRAYL